MLHFGQTVIEPAVPSLPALLTALRANLQYKTFYATKCYFRFDFRNVCELDFRSSPPRDRQPSVTESFALPPDLGSGDMPEYRAYQVGLDGHFIGFEPLVCADDNAAIEQAGRLVNGHDVELWSGPRMVVRLNRKSPLK